MEAPKTSNRGKGYTPEQALQAIEILPDDVKKALGDGGLNALRDLADEAPGTLFHVMAVNKLMSIHYPQPEYQAAVLLHDIGKLTKPEVFAENQMGDSAWPGVDPLRSHVEYGKVLARHYELTPLMYQAINEHHGTLPIGAHDHYLGSEPRSQFTATLMMADTIEAIHASGKLSEDLLQDILRDRENQWIHIDREKLQQDSQKMARELVLHPELTMVELDRERDHGLQSPSPTL